MSSPSLPPEEVEDFRAGRGLQGIIATCVAIAVTLAGCASEQHPVSSPARPEPQPPRHGEWQSIPWTFLGARDSTVRVRYDGGGCVTTSGHVPLRPVAAGNARVVTIAVYAANSNPCAGVGLLGITTVHLDRPLGERKLLHADVTP